MQRVFSISEVWIKTTVLFLQLPCKLQLNYIYANIQTIEEMELAIRETLQFFCFNQKILKTFLQLHKLIASD